MMRHSQEATRTINIFELTDWVHSVRQGTNESLNSFASFFSFIVPVLTFIMVDR